MVAAVRGADDLDLETICSAVRRIKREIGIKVCASLGLLTAESARALADAGVDRFNHNLETSERFFPNICTTHAYRDRVETTRLAREAGMEVCSGGIVGMGETDEDVVEMAFAAGAIEARSIPVNFLDPRPGTPLADRPKLTPERCLKILCLFRFVNPDREIRASAGREICLGERQSLCLLPANSLFADGYLTTPGQASPAVLEMIRGMGMEPAAE
jgi:biotin synthase